MPRRLVSRPRHSAPLFLVAEDSPRLRGGEPPDDLSPRSVGARGPGARAITEGLERVDTIPAMTLAGPETGFDFGRVQPAPVLGRIVRRKPRPQRSALHRSHLSPRSVGARGPGARAITEGLERVDTIPAMTLAGPETGFDFGRVQPAPVLGRIVRRKPRPQRSALHRSQRAEQGPWPVQIQVVHDGWSSPLDSAARSAARRRQSEGLCGPASRASRAARRWAPRCSRCSPCRSAHTRNPRGRCARRPWAGPVGSRRATRRGVHRRLRPARGHRTDGRARSARPPCARCTQRPAWGRTTFVFRHGFSSWWAST